MTFWKHACLAAAVTLSATAVMAQEKQPDMAAQKVAIDKLNYMNGTWVGEAWTRMRDGTVHKVTHTERIGPLLGGTVKVIEGHSYRPDGSDGFNALAIISYDEVTQKYEMRSYAQGRAGFFEMKPTPAGGYTWEIPAGPMKIRYTAVIQNGNWNEIGEYLIEGKPPSKFFEMTVKRTGDTDWPAANPVKPVLPK